MHSSTVITGLIAIAALLNPVLGKSNRHMSYDVAAYWGQNSGDTQQRLAHYCHSQEIDIFILAFLLDPGNSSSLNFANIATEIEDDIKECQSVHKKTILLSLYGERPTGPEFTSEDDAVEKARQLWAAFGPSGSSSSSTSAMRPFGNAAIDGFDFDNEKPRAHLVAFAKELNRLLKESSQKDGRRYSLAAAPQCHFPDANVGPLISSGVAFDYLFIQFYNNPHCSVTQFVKGAKEQPANGFNPHVWQDFATKSANPNVKIFVGVVPTVHPKESGYVVPDKLAEIIGYCKKFANFGGISLWDMSRAANSELLNKAKLALGGAKPSAPAPTIVRPAPSPSISCTPELVGIIEGCSSSSKAVSSSSSSSSSTSSSSASSSSSSSSSSTSSSSSSSSSSSASVSPISSPSFSSSYSYSHSSSSASSPSSAPPRIQPSVLPLVLTVAIMVFLTVKSSLSSANFSSCTVIELTPLPSSTMESTMESTTKEIEQAPEPKTLSVTEPVQSKAPLPQALVKGVVPEVWHKPSPEHVHQWNQCGGDDWNGGRTCQRPYVCKYFSNWYSQCE